MATRTTRNAASFARAINSASASSAAYQLIIDTLTPLIETTTNPVELEVVTHEIARCVDLVREMDETFEYEIEQALIAGFGPEDIEAVSR